MKHVSLVFLLVLSAGIASAEAAAPLPAGQDFGARLKLTRAVPLAELVGNPERFEGKPVLVRGTVSDVCQKKGCWTILRDGEAQVRVRFHDYGFFLPKDCSGEEALVEGRVKIELLSEAKARHYAEESRDSDPASIQGPKRELGFVATGVRLVGRD